MPRATLAQPVLVELAGAAGVGGLALGGGWRIAGAAVAGPLLLAALVPIRRRWLYQLLFSGVRLLRRRRRSTSAAGLAGLLGDYTVESIPVGSRGGRIGAVRCGTTWSLPLVLDLESVFNDDAPVPLRLLADLLQVEDVPLSSVRLITFVTPAQPAANAPAGPAAPLTPLAARYCLITLDTRRAADAIAARGAGTAAVHQILRRCAVHAEQLLATAGLTVRRLDEKAVASLFRAWMGPAAQSAGRRTEQQTAESWADVRVAGTWSTTFAITGSGTDVADRVSRLAAVAPAPVVATSLVLRPDGPRNEVTATMLVRLSAPVTTPREHAVDSLALLARAFDLKLQRVDGEQGSLLRATTPLGLAEAG